MNHFRPIDRDTGFLTPPSVDEWLPERHLARFVVEATGGFELADPEVGHTDGDPEPGRGFVVRQAAF